MPLLIIRDEIAECVLLGGLNQSIAKFLQFLIKDIFI